MPKKEKVNVEVYLEDVRLSHPHLFEAVRYKKDKNSKPRFTAVFMLDKKKHRALIEEIEDGIDEIRNGMFDGRKLKADNICLTDGDDTDKPEYQGHMILRAAASEDRPPETLGRDKRPVGPKDRKLYGGCYVNAIVRLYGYDEYADQVNCGLEAVQHFRKGESFGAGPADTSKFKDYGEDDDEDERDDRPLRDRGSRSRDRDDDDRGSRSRGRSRDDEDEDRGSRSRGRDRDDDDRGSRSRSRDDDDRGSRSRSRDDDDRGSRSRDRDDDDRGSRRRNRDDD